MLQHWGERRRVLLRRFVLLTFVQLVKLALDQYNTAYVELAFASPNAVAFSSYERSDLSGLFNVTDFLYI